MLYIVGLGCINLGIKSIHVFESFIIYCFLGDTLYWTPTPGWHSLYAVQEQETPDESIDQLAEATAQTNGYQHWQREWFNTGRVWWDRWVNILQNWSCKMNSQCLPFSLSKIQRCCKDQLLPVGLIKLDWSSSLNSLTNPCCLCLSCFPQTGLHLIIQRAIAESWTNWIKFEVHVPVNSPVWLTWIFCIIILSEFRDVSSLCLGYRASW